MEPTAKLDNIAEEEDEGEEESEEESEEEFDRDEAVENYKVSFSDNHYFFFTSLMCTVFIPLMCINERH